MNQILQMGLTYVIYSGGGGSPKWQCCHEEPEDEEEIEGRECSAGPPGTDPGYCTSDADPDCDGEGAALEESDDCGQGFKCCYFV